MEKLNGALLLICMFDVPLKSRTNRIERAGNKNIALMWMRAEAREKGLLFICISLWLHSMNAWHGARAKIENSSLRIDLMRNEFRVDVDHFRTEQLNNFYVCFIKYCFQHFKTYQSNYWYASVSKMTLLLLDLKKKQILLNYLKTSIMNFFN